jgi:hypothetical protein
MILLMLMQLISPLMHAHAGPPIAKTGLHVHGLERYSATNHLQNFKTADAFSSSDAAVFGVDAGIKECQNSRFGGNKHSYDLFRWIAVFPPSLAICNTAASPRSSPILGGQATPSNTPRAPPLNHCS